MRRSFGFFGKFWIVLMLAILGGFGWAVVSTKTSLADLAGIFRSREIVAPPPPSAIPSALPSRAAESLAAASSYTTQHMFALFVDVEVLLREGRIKEARELLARTSDLLVPDTSLERFRQVKSRVRSYHLMLLDTAPGATIDLPEVAEIHLQTGTLVVKNLKELPSELRYETLSGIRATVARVVVKNVTRADRASSMALIDIELEKRASRGTETGLAFFELADFCASNGRNEKIVPLLAEGLKRDPNLPKTVFEWKAGRLVDVFLYFLMLRSKADCKQAFDLLAQRYSGSAAVREKILGDQDVMAAYESLFRKPMEIPTKPLEEEPWPTPAPTPTPTLAPTPTPTPSPSPEVEVQDPTQKTKLADDMPKKAIDLVRKGDELYEEAMKHVLNSDQGANPGGWQAANKKALELLTKALRECYQPAEEVIEKANRKQPRTLLDRVREATMTMVLCRKRSISK